jgi:hypothetical protein
MTSTVALDPRFLTGPALVIIGAFILTLWLRLLMVHPVNRVFQLGPFVTELGLVAVLRMRSILFMYGMFFATQGVSSIIFWLIADHDLHNPFVVAFGSFGAVFALGSAYFTLATAARLWWPK